jgi:hypothetical protein
MIPKRFAAGCIVFVSLGAYAAASPWLVSPDGIGPVKIGISLTQLNSVLDESFIEPIDKEDRKCFYVNTDRHPGIGFMIQDSRLVRVDIDGPGSLTAFGIQVGDPESKVRQIYGAKLEIEPNAYDSEERYLTFRSKDGRNAVRFETDQGKIGRFYAGRLSAISLIEGCS